jgi:hypothetical protein
MSFGWNSLPYGGWGTKRAVMGFGISAEVLAEVTTIGMEVMNMYSIKEVVEAVFGEYNDPNYKRIRYATETGVVEPPRVGRTWIYSQEDIEYLRRHFRRRYNVVEA